MFLVSDLQDGLAWIDADAPPAFDAQDLDALNQLLDAQGETDAALGTDQPWSARWEQVRDHLLRKGLGQRLHLVRGGPNAAATRWLDEVDALVEGTCLYRGRIDGTQRILLVAATELFPAYADPFDGTVLDAPQLPVEEAVPIPRGATHLELWERPCASPVANLVGTPTDPRLVIRWATGDAAETPIRDALTLGATMGKLIPLEVGDIVLGFVFRGRFRVRYARERLRLDTPRDDGPVLARVTGKTGSMLVAEAITWDQVG